MRTLLPHRRLALRLIRFSGGRPWAVLSAMAVLTLAAAAAAVTLRLDTDVLDLIPTSNPVVRDFRETLERFGSIDILLVALELRGEEELDGDLAYAERLVEKLRGSERIAWVECNAGDLRDSVDEVLRQATLFMTAGELEEFAGRFTGEGLEARVGQLARDARTALTGEQRELLALDPMGVWPLVGGRLGTEDLASRFDSETGYIIDEAREHLLMLVKPVRPAADVPFGRELVAELEDLRRDCDDAWRSDEWEGDPPPVLVGGSYAIAVDDAREVTRDAAVGGLVALAGVILLFMVIFRRAAALLIVAVPLVAGLTITFGFAALLLGRLNPVTSAFSALLIGLGVDFIIVLYGRYVEERRRGAGHMEALEAFGRTTAAGVLLGAVTTAATFLSFLISRFRGLSELGLITGAGILILVLTVFLLLPALLTVIERVRPGRAHVYHAFGIQQLCGFSLRHPLPVVLITLVVTALLFVPMLRLHYDDDVLNMRSATNRGLVVQRRLMEAFDIRFTPIMVRVDGATADESLARAQRLLDDLEPLADGENLARVESAAALLPPPERQRKNLEALRGITVDRRDVHRRFAAALDAEGLNAAPFAGGLDLALDALELERPLSAATFAGSTIGHLLGRYLHAGEDTASTLIYCYPPAGKWRREVPPPLLRVVEQAPGAVLTSPVLISQELKAIVWRDALLAALLGLLVVYTLMALEMRNPWHAVLGLLPLCVGMVWMAGGMVLLGMAVNFLNIFVFTMIIGIGVDYGIHLTHRWNESGTDPVPLAATSRAILVAAFTTVIGFGSLALSHSPGLRSMGTAAILGASATALVSITFLPALMAWGERRRGNRST